MTPEQQQEIELFKSKLQLDLERFKAEIQATKDLWVERSTREREAWLHGLKTEMEVFKAVTEFAGITIRSLILVNGGAIIGILTFLGHLWNRDSPAAKATAQGISPALSWLIAGLTLALLTAGASYISQVLFSEWRDANNQVIPTPGNVARFVAVGCAAISLACFIMGALTCLNAFKAPAGF
jgi:hypothetical protein